VFTQELERREVHRAGREEGKHDWKTPSEASSDETAKRLIFAQPELLRAESEHRGKPGYEVKTPLLDFTEVGDQFGSSRAFFADETAHVGKERAIRDV
jgi:hypothetical protein